MGGAIMTALLANAVTLEAFSSKSPRATLEIITEDADAVLLPTVSDARDLSANEWMCVRQHGTSHTKIMQAQN
jgi:hypothetical protein